jgi:hypothetical protein
MLCTQLQCGQNGEGLKFPESVADKWPGGESYLIFGFFVASLVLLEFILRYDESVARRRAEQRLPPDITDLDRPPQFARPPIVTESAPTAPSTMMSLAQALNAQGRGTQPSDTPAQPVPSSTASTKLVK